MAFWRYPPEVCGPTTVKHSDNQKRKKIESIKACGHSHKATNSCGDPHA